MKLSTVQPTMARRVAVKGLQRRCFVSGSLKASGELRLEGSLERLTALALEVHPEVKSLCTQPFTVRLDTVEIFDTQNEARRAVSASGVDARDGVERIYTPDFLVETTSPVWLAVEAKSSLHLASLSSSLQRRGAVLSALGYRFLVVSDLDVGQPGLAGNLVRLRDALRYQDLHDTSAEMATLHDALTRLGETFTVADLRRLNVPDTAVYLGLATGVLGSDLRSGAFSVKTIVWPAKGDFSHLVLLSLEPTDHAN